MRLNRIILAIVVTIAVLGGSLPADAVVNFTKHGSVFPQGGSGAFDEAAVERPTIIKDGGTYKMWYMGEDASGALKIGIVGHRSSIDRAALVKSITGLLK